MLERSDLINFEKRNSDGNSALWLVIKASAGNVAESTQSGDLVRNMVKLGASVNSVHPSSQDSLLHTCARAGFEEACLFLLDNGAFANVTNR
ncbi:unnamed protein product, partial [Notodromas monacha]